MSMQRPMMDISYMPDDPHGGGRRGGGFLSRYARLQKISDTVWQALRKIVRICMYNPLSAMPGASRFRNEDGTPIGRFIRGLLYRLAFVPVFGALTACAFVYSGTHPRPVNGELDPSSVGVYYEAVNLRTDDNVRLDAWFVPSLEASKVLDKRDKVLRERRPAVILVHDYAEHRQQLLPLVRPLHDAGFVVLVPAMRGCGTSESAGQTFGLHESLDVKACIDLLRKRNFVDPDRISIIGIGSGANAAMMASQRDQRVLAMILENPNNDINDLITAYVAPKQQYLAWVRPMCKWAFEIAYEVDAEELNVSRDAMKKRQRTVLMLNSASSDTFASKEQVEQIKHFLTLRSEEKLLKQPMSEVKRLAGAGN